MGEIVQKCEGGKNDSFQHGKKILFQYKIDILHIQPPFYV